MIISMLNFFFSTGHPPVNDGRRHIQDNVGAQSCAGWATLVIRNKLFAVRVSAAER
jgi:hypothetical protein